MRHEMTARSRCRIGPSLPPAQETSRGAEIVRVRALPELTAARHRPRLRLFPPPLGGRSARCACAHASLGSDSLHTSPLVLQPRLGIPWPPGQSRRAIEPMLAILRTNTAGKLMAAMCAVTLLAAFAGWRIAARAQDGAAAFRITACGHACFLLETAGRTRLLLDPVAPALGYPATPVAVDLVLVSHAHFDHANVQLAEG
ncbi:MAG: hypothetical protein FJ125_13385, partial [Deltaproteobacteria bacterium]|nr:hypothetical protein [Deltaproteobacteria bacterium]